MSGFPGTDCLSGAGLNCQNRQNSTTFRSPGDSISATHGTSVHLSFIRRNVHVITLWKSNAKMEVRFFGVLLKEATRDCACIMGAKDLDVKVSAIRITVKATNGARHVEIAEIRAYGLKKLEKN